MTSKTKIVNDFLQLCSVLDTESTGLDAAKAEICELGVCKPYVNQNGFSFPIMSKMYGTENPIPFEASAANNISRKMIEDKPTFSSSLDEVNEMLELKTRPYLAAHSIKYDKTILQSNIDRLNIGLVFAENNKWLCTHRMAKQLFLPTEEVPEISYSLSYLRYYLDLDVPSDMGAHRAGDDAFVCAKLLEYIASYVLDMFPSISSGEELGEMLCALTNEPIVYTTMNYGKYRNEKLSDVARKDPKYLMWCLTNMSNLKVGDPNYEEELANSILNALDEATK